jgi:hypothetical protein
MPEFRVGARPYRLDHRPSYRRAEQYCPFRHFYWRAEGGGIERKCLTFAFFWPSANSLPWRKGVRMGSGLMPERREA